MGLRLNTGVSIDRILQRCSDKLAVFSAINLIVQQGLAIVQDHIVIATKPMKFDNCLSALGWGSVSNLGWRKILPMRFLRG